MSTKTFVWPAIAMVVGVLGGYFFASDSAPTAPAASSSANSGDAPVVPVTLATLEKRKIVENVTAYGVVVSAPGESLTVTVGYEARVKSVRVASGQSVTAGTPLVELEPSSETQLQRSESRDERDAAQAALSLARQRVGLGLATKADVQQAEQRLRTAESRLRNLTHRGSEGRVLLAEQDGIVSNIEVATGAIVPAGAPLLEMVAEGQIAVRLGVEPEDIAHIRDSMPVAIEPVNMRGSSIDGKVYLISREVDSESRLVNVFVAPANSAKLLLNMYVRGTLAISAQDVLAVPRAAVLPYNDGYRLFVERQGKAEAHDVNLGVEDDEFAEVYDETLKPGDRVVVVGNSELESGTSIVDQGAP